MYEGVLPACMLVHHALAETGVIDSYKLHCGCSELNPVLLGVAGAFNY